MGATVASAAQDEAIARPERHGRRRTGRSPAIVPSGSTRSSRPARPTAASTRGRAGMEPTAGPIGDGRRERGEHPFRGADRGVGGEHLPTMQLVDPDPGEVERRSPATVHPVDRLAVDLDLADSHVPLARHEAERVAAGDRTAAQACRSRPAPRPLTEKTRSIASVAGRAAGRCAAARSASAARTASQPLPGRAGRGEDRGAGEGRRREEVRNGRDDGRDPLRLDRIGLGDHREPGERRRAHRASRGAPASGRAGRRRRPRRAARHRSHPPRPACCRPAGRARGRRRNRRPSRRRGPRCAYPTSMVIPRRRSSGRRSASIPVRARSSVVLP